MAIQRVKANSLRFRKVSAISRFVDQNIVQKKFDKTPFERNKTNCRHIRRNERNNLSILFTL